MTNEDCLGRKNITDYYLGDGSDGAKWEKLNKIYRKPEEITDESYIEWLGKLFHSKRKEGNN